MADDKDKKEKGAKGKDGGAAKGGAAKGGAKAAASPSSKKASKAEGAPAAAAGGGVSSGRPRAPKEKPRLATYYRENVRPALIEKFGYQSHMQAPRMEKIVINMGVGDAIQDGKLLDAAVNELTQISGQKPSIRRAKKAISNFKLREGLPIGCKVTLRGARMF
jgi:hypothetical protein